MSFSNTHQRKKGISSLSNNLFTYLSEYYDTSDLFSLSLINRRFFNKFTNNDSYRLITNIFKKNISIEDLLSNNSSLLIYYLERLNLEEDSLESMKFCQFLLGTLLKKHEKTLILHEKIGPKGLFYLCKNNLLLSFQSISLRDNKLLDEGAIYLAQSLPFLNRLEKLNVSLNSFTTNAVKMIFNGLKLSSSIKEIDISGNNSFAEGMDSIEDFLKVNKSIKILNISYNTVQDNGLARISEGLLFSNSIQSLDLSANKITKEGMTALGEIFNKENYFKVEEISYCQSYLCKKSIVKAKSENGTRVEGEEEGKEEKEEENHYLRIKENLEGSKHIEKSNLKLENEINDEEVRKSNKILELNKKIICNIPNRSQVNTLRTIKIKETPRNRQDSKQNHNRQKTCFEFDLGKKRFSQIEKINLSSNRIESQGASCLFKQLSLLGKVKSIIEINLSNTSLNSDVFYDLYEFLSQTTSLQVLNLRQNQFDSLNSDILFSCLSDNSSLKKVNFESCSLSSSCIISIFKAASMSINKSIVYLNISNNNINAETCLSFSSFLKLTRIEELVMSNNQIGDEGLESLVINSNSSLKSFNFSLNEISDDGFSIIIQNFLESNRKVHDFNQQGYVFDFSLNDITDQSATDFFNKISFTHISQTSNFYISGVNLSGCCLTDLSVDAICNSLIYSSIERLFLNDNQFSNGGLLKIVNSCLCSTGIKYLNISNNDEKSSKRRRGKSFPCENSYLKGVVDELLLYKPIVEVLY